MSKFCQKCGNELPDEAQFCPKCGYNFISTDNNANGYSYNSAPQYNMPQNNAVPTKKRGGCLKGLLIIPVIIIGFFILSGIISGYNKKASSNNSSQSTKLKSNNTEQNATKVDDTIAEDTYENNEFFNVVDVVSSVDAFGSTTVIHKVEAKQNVSVSATMIAYSKDGSVIGKSTDDIVLTEGKTNYFRYYFEDDVSNAKLSTTAKAKSDSFMTGERDGVELVEYNINKDYVYLTLKQNVDDISFAKYKILLYNGDTIVGSEEGYFNVHTDNLDGVDATDVLEVWTIGKTFDKIEYIYEP